MQTALILLVINMMFNEQNQYPSLVLPESGFFRPAKTTDKAVKNSEKSRPDRVFRQGDWELQITFRLKNTRSEGQHGVLFYKGRIVKPESLGEIRQTDLGRIRYYADEKKIKFSWELSGWNFIDQSRIKNSQRKVDGELTPAEF